ncbi:hypothetical protein ACJVC5_09315 [Peredibacter sp. HCB2-198]|uniref:hypothetical protein n=1 Tax=Peredibacter sp. HCB2-198 TaxID=3383025 RepID=UPI0038B6A052
MKETAKVLKIYQLSNPLLNTEWLSILGDKYQKTLSFEWSLTNDINEAEIVVWDGVISSKSGSILAPLIEEFKEKKVLLLVGESVTSLRNHPMVNLVSLDELRYVEISGWGVLPEEVLGALEVCHQKLTHV